MSLDIDTLGSSYSQMFTEYLMQSGLLISVDLQYDLLCNLCTK
jgi:hypothetical protein